VSPEIKIEGIQNRGNEQTLLLVQFTQSFITETFSTIPQLQEENVIKHHHACTINVS
jgi:hypothetical protein